MASFNVRTTEELTSSLSQAKSGDTIYLAPGTYSALTIVGKNFDKSVTITSADSSNKAVINALTISKSSGIVMSNVDLTATNSSTDYNFKVTNSTNVTIDKVKITGRDFDQQTMIVRDSNSVTISNSEFTNSYNALTIFTNRNMTIKDNLFHYIRCDGIHGNLVSGLNILRNVFTDFHPRGDIGNTGDHADAIQLWTDNTTSIATNINIDSNVFIRGNGSKVQGIWLRDNSNKLPFTDVSITNNVISGGMWNGIGVFSAQNVSITGNWVGGYKDQMSWIRLNNVSGATVARNTSSGYVYEQSDGTIQQNNIKIDLGATAPDYAKLLSLTPSLTKGWKDALAGVSVSAAIDPGATVKGTSGDDTLKSAASGHVDLIGGAGNDTYYVYHNNTSIIENANSGQDKVYASVSFTLPGNVEDLYLLAPGVVGTGNELDNRIEGGTGSQVLYGLGGNDLIVAGDGDDMLSSAED